MNITAPTVMKRASWRFRSLLSFFGLNNQYIKNVYDKISQMQYYGKWNFLFVYKMPVGLREYFYNELVNLKKEEEEAAKNPNKQS